MWNWSRTPLGITMTPTMSSFCATGVNHRNDSAELQRNRHGGRAGRGQTGPLKRFQSGHFHADRRGKRQNPGGWVAGPSFIQTGAEGVSVAVPRGTVAPRCPPKTGFEHPFGAALAMSDNYTYRT